MADTKISGLTGYTPAVDTDVLPIVDTTTATTKKITWANIKSTLKTYLDTLYSPNVSDNQSLYRQAIINGNFDVWQRGTSFTNPASGTYLSDRYRYSFTTDGGTNPNIIISQQKQGVGDLFGSYYFYRVNVDGAGSSYGNGAFSTIFQQRIEGGTSKLCGLNKRVTISFYARSSIVNKKLGIYIIQNYGTGGSPTTEEEITGFNQTLTSSWVKYTFTFTTNTLVGKTFGTDNNDFLSIVFRGLWGVAFSNSVGDTVAETYVGAGNIDIAQVQLNAGSVALPFMPKSFAEELRDCQRYYYRLSSADNVYAFFCSGRVNSTTSAAGIITYPVQMRILPTLQDISATNYFSVNGIGATVIALDQASKSVASVTFTVASGLTAGQGLFINAANTTGAYLGFSAEL